MAAVFFYLFATIMIASACVVIFARNPVISVLFLILAFCNGAGLFLLSGAEFLAISVARRGIGEVVGYGRVQIDLAQPRRQMIDETGEPLARHGAGPG